MRRARAASEGMERHCDCIQRLPTRKMESKMATPGESPSSPRPPETPPFPPAPLPTKILGFIGGSVT